MTVSALRMVHYPNNGGCCSAIGLQSVKMADELKFNLSFWQRHCWLHIFGWWTIVILAVTLSDSQIPATFLHLQHQHHTHYQAFAMALSLMYSESGPFLGIGKLGGHKGNHQLGGADEHPNAPTPTRLTHPEEREYQGYNLAWTFGPIDPNSFSLAANNFPLGVVCHYVTECR